MAEVTEEFVKGFGIESGKYDDLVKEISDSMEKEKDVKIKEQVRIGLMNYLREKNQIKIPEVMVRNEATSKIEGDNLVKQIMELDGDLTILLDEIDESKSSEDFASDLESIELKISRLGAINLAAMEEFEQEEKRDGIKSRFCC